MATKKYLDKTGLTYFWGKIKNAMQAKLVSGTNIKTFNGASVLGAGNIYGVDKVYNATLSSASGGVATYTFSLEDGLVSGRIYAVKFPTPTVANAIIILSDGTTSASILLPPVSANSSAQYDVMGTNAINSTEAVILLYNGTQFVSLNQRQRANTDDIMDSAVTPAKASFTTYSTAEQEVGTWFDGKTIYRKVIVASNPDFSVGDHAFPHSISNFDDLISLNTLFNLGWDTAVWAAADFLAQRGCSMRVDRTNIHWENSNSAIANWTGTFVFVIEYTKSS